MVRRTLKLARQVLLVLLITFALSEVAFRVYHHFHPSFIFYDPSYNRARGRPLAPDYDFHLNSKGFKDVEFKPEKEPGTYRIVALGDSFAFGVVPYKFNYLTLLEENLNRGRKVELINMGIVGIAPRDYAALLANEGLQLKPDMVLVSFFIGNDFDKPGKWRRLYSYSYVMSFIAYLIAVNRSYEGEIIHGPATYDDNAPTLTDEAFLDMESERSEIYRKQNQVFAGDFEAAFAHVMNIKRLCEERQIALTVVFLPDKVQVDQSLQSRVFVKKGLGTSPDQFDFALPNRMLAERLKQQNVPFIDLQDEFARAQKQTPQYKPNDTHWNIAGNRLAAETIARQLSLVPKVR